MPNKLRYHKHGFRWIIFFFLQIFFVRPNFEGAQLEPPFSTRSAAIVGASRVGPLCDDQRRRRRRRRRREPLW